MPPESVDPTLGLFIGGMLLLSMMAGLHVLHMRSSGSVLPYEPRRPVPWGPIGCVLAMTFLFMTALAAFGGKEHTSEPETASDLLSVMLSELLIVGGFLLVIALFSKAKLRDLGVPTTAQLWIRDVCVGAAACLAALAPVLLMQGLLQHLFFSDQMSEHPLIKSLTDAPPSLGVFVLSGVFAVIVAPVCEEITFRLLLQGWLERWEHDQVEWRSLVASALAAQAAQPAGNSDAVILEPVALAEVSTVQALEIPVEPQPPQRGIASLPYGWFPIIVSSVAFGLAHFGYGPEPVPLFFLALMLGFVYQRTHRIIPSIVTHALFNLFNMIVLWRMMYCHG